MATSRDIRRLAFQSLYQLDARNGADPESVLASIIDDEEHIPNYTDGERKKAFLMASEAFAKRADADAFMLELAPTWPAHRQAAVDRAILRLAYYEMVHAGSEPKIAVNEAVELAKTFSTEKSPSFINGLLDKVLKKVLADRGEPAPAQENDQPADREA
jgi:N utilization substance protein B